MTPSEKAFWLRVQRRVAVYEPRVAAALLRAFAVLRESIDARDLAALVATGNVEGAIRAALSDSVLDRAFAPFRAEIQSVTKSGFDYFARDLPHGGRVAGAPAVLFDYLSPNVIAAVGAVNTKVMTTLKADVREVVRAHIEAGLRAGLNPRTTAQGLQSVIGLAPNQAKAVANFRAQLEAGDRAALDRALKRGVLNDALGGTAARQGHAGGAGLTPKQYATLDRTLGNRPLTPKQIDAMVDAYRKRTLAWNAETNARTATLDTFKASQRLAWDEGKAQGLFEGLTLFKRWSGVLDDRERPEHVAMEGEVAPIDSPYSNGEMNPGESTYNCRCLSIVTAKVN